VKRLAGLVVAVGAWHALVRWTERWGTLPFDVERPMPGDGLIASPAMSATRAFVIDAPPDEVYPWFAQMGPGRAGWYSYDWIDNAGIESAREIHPEWVIAESEVSLGALAGVEFVSVDVRPGRHFVIALAEAPLLSFTMAYRFEAWGESATRVVVRARSRSNRGRWLDPAIRYLLGPGDFVMMRRQLLGVRQRAEGSKGAARSTG
jgi:hypothetical protein